eukprot:gene12501-15715_t
MSKVRSKKDESLQRLVILSSLVDDPQKVTRAILPDHAWIVYDWKNCSLQELLSKVKKVLGGNKVLSIAVIAPSQLPGTVGILQGMSTGTASLASDAEMASFWKVLSRHLYPAGKKELTCRIDLLGCRVMEELQLAAALLRDLQKLTNVAFAASDDPISHYRLSTVIEDPTNREVFLDVGDVNAVDLYFDRVALLGEAAAAYPPKPKGAGAGARAGEAGGAGARAGGAGAGGGASGGAGGAGATGGAGGGGGGMGAGSGRGERAKEGEGAKEGVEVKEGEGVKEGVEAKEGVGAEARAGEKEGKGAEGGGEGAKAKERADAGAATVSSDVLAGGEGEGVTDSKSSREKKEAWGRGQEGGGGGAESEAAGGGARVSSGGAGVVARAGA